MKKEYLKYLHYYFGCPVMFKTGNKSDEWQTTVLTSTIYQQLFQYQKNPIIEFKIFLKRIETISDVDFSKFLEVMSTKVNFETLEEFNQKLYEDADSFIFLIENQYDVFKLIEKNIAMDQNSETYKLLIKNGKKCF